jgi:hypothetical protein
MERALQVRSEMEEAVAGSRKKEFVPAVLKQAFICAMKAFDSDSITDSGGPALRRSFITTCNAETCNMALLGRSAGIAIIEAISKGNRERLQETIKTHLMKRK